MKIKIIVGIVLFIFWTIVTAVLTAGLVFYQNNKTGQGTANGTNPGLIIPAGQSVTLNAAEVAKHNSAGDCWMILNGKVYDFTGFLASHPGGIGTMTPYCGADGSLAYTTKDLNPGRSHSSYAYSLLSSYYLGDLNQTINSSQVTQVKSQGASAAQGVRGGGDD